MLALGKINTHKESASIQPRNLFIGEDCIHLAVKPILYFGNLTILNQSVIRPVDLKLDVGLDI